VKTKNPLVALTATAALAIAMTHAVQRGVRVSEPRDICAAARACDRLGLFWTTGSEHTPEPVKGYSTITIATEPIATEHANSLAVGRPLGLWRGKARAYSGNVCLGDIDDSLRCVAWGGVTLIGDPDVVDRLVEHR